MYKCLYIDEINCVFNIILSTIVAENPIIAVFVSVIHQSIYFI